MTQPRQKYRECVVLEPGHIPPEYQPLGDFHDTDTTLHRYLVKQCEAGNVRRFRLGRLLYVHKDHIEEARKRYEKCEHGEQRIQVVSNLEFQSVCQSLGDIASGLGHVVTLLDRIASALEIVATDPKSDDSSTKYPG